MPTVTRTVATGTFDAQNLFSLQHEVRADMSVGSDCSGIVLTPGNPNDSLAFDFAAAPNIVNLDAAIAAYPTFVGVPPTSQVTVAATWVPVWEVPLRELDTCYFRFESDIRDVTGNIDDAFMRVNGSCRRLAGGICTNLISSVDAPANGFGLIVQVVVNGNAYSVQIQTTAGETLDLDSRLQITFQTP